MDTDNLSFDDLEKLSENPDMLFNARRRLWTWDQRFFQPGSEIARFFQVAGDHYERVGIKQKKCRPKQLKQGQQHLLETVKSIYSLPVPQYARLCNQIRADLTNQYCKMTKYLSERQKDISMGNIRRRLWMWDMDYLCTEGGWGRENAPGGSTAHYEHQGHVTECSNELIESLQEQNIAQLELIFDTSHETPGSVDCSIEAQKVRNIHDTLVPYFEKRQRFSRGLNPVNHAEQYKINGSPNSRGSTHGTGPHSDGDIPVSSSPKGSFWSVDGQNDMANPSYSSTEEHTAAVKRKSEQAGHKDATHDLDGRPW
jgi:hypothetical protein